MAETTPTPANLPAIAHLEAALALPEPMCLAMLQIYPPTEPVPGSALGPDATATLVMEEAARRLRNTLRDYDELTQLDDNRFVLVLRTLADASMLTSRMHNLYAIMTRAYALDDVEIDADVFLGAAIRVPQETPGQLVTRVDQAVVLSHSATNPGPVML